RRSEAYEAIASRRPRSGHARRSERPEARPPRRGPNRRQAQRLGGRISGFGGGPHQDLWPRLRRPGKGRARPKPVDASACEAQGNHREGQGRRPGPDPQAFFSEARPSPRPGPRRRPVSGRVRPILPVILCGGAGTRLWPVSTEAAPKPFHALLSDKSLFQMTVARIAGHGEDGFLAPMIVCGRTHRSLVEAQLEAIGVEAALLVLEPCGRGTAPIAAIAAALVAERWPDAVVLLLSADHMITDEAEFRRTIRRGAAIADDWIVTLGVAPTRPETGYGYIRRGARLADELYAVDRFVEKPDLATAQGFVADGEHSWNAGVFLFRPELLLDELKASRPGIATAAIAPVPAQ